MKNIFLIEKIFHRCKFAFSRVFLCIYPCELGLCPSSLFNELIIYQKNIIDVNY
jgi:hypothetical protein